MSAPEERRLAAIMFTDMVGYSALSQRDESLAQELLEEHRALLRELFPRFHGREIKTIGDAFLVEFVSALEAVQCAVEIQRTLVRRNSDVPADRRIEVRIGIHLGDVIHRNGDVYGDGVNIASRIEPLAGAGGICVSMDVERQIRNAPGTLLKKLAPTELKNISVPMELFRIVLPWESPVRPDETRQPVSAAFRKSSRVVGAAIGMVVLAFASWWFSARSKEPTKPVASLITAAPPAVAQTPPAAPASAAVSEKSIAVLPFANLSTEKENEFFTDGVHEDLLTALAKVRDLKVISRTSVLGYRDAAKRNLRQIASELGVANVLEGSVRRAGSKARITVQLIDARTDQHLWAETYDRDVADIFAVQTEVAREITKALQANLSAGEQSLIARRPTRNQEAYDWYLRGRALLQSLPIGPQRSQHDPTIAAYEKAVAIDPDFALAYAELSYVHGIMYWYGRVDPTPERRALALTALESARRLAPDSPETRVAEGSFAYFCDNNWEQALGKFVAAERDLPNDAQLQARMGFAYRRLGRWSDALGRLERAVLLNPLDEQTAGEMVKTVFGLRRYPQVIEQTSRLLVLLPNAENQHSYAIQARLSVDHDWAAYSQARSLRPLPAWDPNGLSRGVLAATWKGDLAAAERCLADPRFPAGATSSADGVLVLSVPFARAELARLRGDQAASVELAREALADFEKGGWTPRQEIVVRVRIAQAKAYAGTEEEGVREMLVGLREVRRRDKMVGTAVAMEVARTMATLGRREEALNLLRECIAAPGFSSETDVSAEQVRHDPYFVGLRDDPRFEEILRSEKPL